VRECKLIFHKYTKIRQDFAKRVKIYFKRNYLNRKLKATQFISIINLFIYICLLENVCNTAAVCNGEFLPNPAVGVVVDSEDTATNTSDQILATADIGLMPVDVLPSLDLIDTTDVHEIVDWEGISNFDLNFTDADIADCANDTERTGMPTLRKGTSQKRKKKSNGAKFRNFKKRRISRTRSTGATATKKNINYVTTSVLNSINGVNIVGILKAEYSKLDIVTKRELFNIVMKDFPLCNECRIERELNELEENDEMVLYCHEKECNCAIYSKSRYHENGFFIGSVGINQFDMDYQPAFAQSILSTENLISRRGTRGQLRLRNLQPVNFGRMRNKQNRYMIPWNMVPDAQDRRYVDQVLDAVEGHVDNFIQDNNELYAESVDKILGPIVHRHTDGTMRRDAVLLVSYSGTEVQSYHTDQKCRNDGLSVLYSLQNDTYLDVILGSHVSENLNVPSSPNTRVSIPKGHFIVFSGGLYHRGINYEHFNVRLHMYVDFLGSHRAAGFVFNTE